jgi:glutaredoxin-related protein
MIALLLLTTALAEEPAPIVVYRERTEIDFESVDITGELVKPEGNLITERQEAVFNPLIRLRTDWNEEMSASVNEIK